MQGAYICKCMSECDAVPCCGAGQSVRHHLLTNYMHAILSVLLAQFTGLGFLDGMEGVIKLAEASPYIQVSAMACLYLQAWPGLAYMLAIAVLYAMSLGNTSQSSCSLITQNYTPDLM